MGNDVHRPSQPILVLGKARRVIDAVACTRGGATSREVQQTTRLPASTTTRLLQNLVAEGFLDLVDGKYHIGLGVLRWAHTRRSGSQLAELAQPHLGELRDETGETSVLFVRQDNTRVLIGIAETRHEVVRLVSVGQVMPLHAGSAGKVFLAFDEHARAQALDGQLTAYTRATITDPELLRAELATVKASGRAISVAERDTGTASISAPVRSHAGALTAAIGIGVPEQRFTDANRAAWIPSVVAAARRLSENLGYPHEEEADG